MRAPIDRACRVLVLLAAAGAAGCYVELAAGNALLRGADPSASGERVWNAGVAVGTDWDWRRQSNVGVGLGVAMPSSALGTDVLKTPAWATDLHVASASRALSTDALRVRTALGLFWAQDAKVAELWGGAGLTLHPAKHHMVSLYAGPHFVASGNGNRSGWGPFLRARYSLLYDDQAPRRGEGE